ncbi:NAD-dependent epimerase/dehydratase family protein [Saccharopolyspora rhizosphaerae]|uniref:NAD-dependent epimerase/dehydratase family protein n=1 Tax=Saccharopolyspora rhizosphaerae TaxID=2492662 RepID=A0A426JM18_9PSEU|nr:NAD-dependent epimerase/dehydratase family protein [Saccharopolyspora rhizosphaerae]RRO14204.1 NAD-dependent epimerase/dehydratase family protein [Saccharopolyspora rhizosphaerae]
MSWSFDRAVVTGGAGFLGAPVCAELLRRGTSVRCLDNFATSAVDNVRALLLDPRFELVEHDIAREPFPAEDVDLVLHLASPASPVDYLRMPVETLQAGSHGTAHALELAERTGARFLLASTSEVYGDPLQHPQREDYWGNVNPVGPRAVYDEAKRYAEALTSCYRAHRSVDTRIVRLFNSYGPGMRPGDGRVVSTFVSQALAGDPITVNGDGSQTRSPCYVDDTVRGLLAVAAGDHVDPVNIGRPDEMTVLEIAELVRSLTGTGSPITHVAAVVDEPARRCPDITVAEQVLGWRPEVDVVEGLRRTIDWFAARPAATATG